MQKTEENVIGYKGKPSQLTNLQIIKDGIVFGSVEIASKTIFVDKPKLQND